jgi:hypothetical protein
MSGITTAAWVQHYLQEGGCDVRTSIDDSHKPLVRLSIRVGLPTSSARVLLREGRFFPDIKGKWEREISTIRAGLIPAPSNC